MNNELLRKLPSVDAVKRAPELAAYVRDLPEDLVTRAVRDALDALRAKLRSVEAEQVPDRADVIDAGRVAVQAAAVLTGMLAPRLRPVLNATGVVVHTNLGRSPLGSGVWKRMEAVALGYCNLEYDLARGERGHRSSHLESSLRLLTGAPAALVVNNCAAAVLLVLSALARGREVVVSRGELVEIGGSFRLPEVMAQGGALLREVGTTNRTHVRDYEDALNDRTGLVLRVHRSNYAMSGFTAEVPREELLRLARARGVPFFEDLGSGLMLPCAIPGLPDSDTVPAVVRAGVDLVSFSGDKLLGGPQAGILLGTVPLIQRLKSHPLNRALRPDKITLAGLEAACLSYLDGSAVREIPTVAMLCESREETRLRAHTVAASLVTLERVEVRVVDTQARVGGGALPELSVPSAGISLSVAGVAETHLEEALRRGQPPVIGRIEQGRVILDLKCVPVAAMDTLAAATAAALRFCLQTA